MVTLLIAISGCDKKLNEINVNPNGVDLSNANVNLLLPGILSRVSEHYTDLDFSYTSGVVQHLQRDGWFTGFNDYLWSPEDWVKWYDVLRNNDLLIKNANRDGFVFHEGIGLVVRAFVYGNIADLWGDAPYSQSMKGDEGVTQPVYDSQEDIYKGVLADLERAAELFSKNDTRGIISSNDLIYAGDAVKWHKFANSLRLRYAMRLSTKLPQQAEQIIKAVYSSQVYIDKSSDDANVEYLGNTANDSWKVASQFDTDGGSNYRRIKIGKGFLDLLKSWNDPRIYVWVKPVHCQWVEDLNLSVATDDAIRKDGVLQSVKSLTDLEYRAEIAKGHKFTRHYNPTKLGYKLDTDLYVGIGIGLKDPDSYNLNPTPGQVVQNQHVSQLSLAYTEKKGGFLKRRIASASETYFILAEAALKGWITGGAEEHYNNGVKNSLQVWGVESSYATLMAKPAVKFNNTLEQLIEQKWIASWNNTVESWMDFRRLGLPKLKPGPGSAQAVLPVRFIYGDNEVKSNEKNLIEALTKLEDTPYSNVRGKNSQWSKPWLLQGTNKPW